MIKMIVRVSVDSGVEVVAVDVSYRNETGTQFEPAKQLALKMGEAALAEKRYGRFEIEFYEDGVSR